MTVELFIATARDRRAAEILEQAGGQTADDLIAAYAQVDDEQAAAYRTAVLGRVRTILGAKYGRTGEPPRAEVLAAWKQAEQELAQAAPAHDRPVLAGKHPSPELAEQNRVHGRAVQLLAADGKELDHSEDEYLEAYARAEAELAARGA